MQYLITMRKVALALAILGGAGCAGGAAYGPSADDRLDEATENIGTVQASGGLEEAIIAIESTDCPRVTAALVEVLKENDEEGKVAGLTGVLGRLQASNKTIQEVIGDRPGSAYFSGKTTDGMEHDLPVFIQACEASHIDAEQTLDKLIREILMSPVVTDFVGKKRNRQVKKPRVDFDLLANAISVLDPVDQSDLLALIEKAKVQIAKKKPPRKRRR